MSRDTNSEEIKIIMEIIESQGLDLLGLTLDDVLKLRERQESLESLKPILINKLPELESVDDYKKSARNKRREAERKSKKFKK